MTQKVCQKYAIKNEKKTQEILSGLGALASTLRNTTEFPFLGKETKLPKVSTIANFPIN